MKTNQNQNITRIETGGEGRRVVRGWGVRIYRRGVRFNQFFSDSTHGGKNEALAEARKVRDEQLEKMPAFSRAELAKRNTVRNTSGVRGVRVRTTKIEAGGKVYSYEHVEATWSEAPGKVVKKIFSVAKLGKDEAWRQAVECREKAIAAFS